MTEEKLYKASEWEEARRENAKHKPVSGDYWFEEHFVPVMLVLEVSRNHVTICKKTKAVDATHWSWDVRYAEMVSRSDFVERLCDCRLANNRDIATVKEFIGE